MKKTVDGNDTRLFLYSASGQLINEMSATGSWQCGYVYLNGRPLARIYNVVSEPGGGTNPPNPPADSKSSSAPGGGGVVQLDGGSGGSTVTYKFLYYHLDHLGTPVAMTDASKTIVWSSDYYPFGGLYDETVVQDNEFRFPGQYHDRETDLYYNWHRYYEPALGRYTTSDPIGLAGGDVNSYRYVLNRPLNYLDRSGLISDSDPIIWGETSDILDPGLDFLERTWEENATVISLGLGWATGLGAEVYEFGPESAISRGLAHSSIVLTAIKDFERCQFEQGDRYEFETEELLHSLATLGLADDFIGSADSVYIEEGPDGCFNIRLVNYTDIASFTKYYAILLEKGYGDLLGFDVSRNDFMLPPYPRLRRIPTPGGRMKQVYNITICP